MSNKKKGSRCLADSKVVSSKAIRPICFDFVGDFKRRSLRELLFEENKGGDNLSILRFSIESAKKTHLKWR